MRGKASICPGSPDDHINSRSQGVNRSFSDTLLTLSGFDYDIARHLQ